MKKYKTIAVVGASKTPGKEAYSVPEYMKYHGYKIVPINPTADKIHDEKSYPNLAALPSNIAKKIEIVDVFRPSEELPEVAKQVVEMKKRYGGATLSALTVKDESINPNPVTLQMASPTISQPAATTQVTLDTLSSGFYFTHQHFDSLTITPSTGSSSNSTINFP